MTEIMVPIFGATDAAETAKWYERWGFEVVGEHRFGPDFPLYVFLERNGVQLHLSEHTGDATPGTLVYFWVDDVDEVAKIFDAKIHDQRICGAKPTNSGQEHNEDAEHRRPTSRDRKRSASPGS